MSTVETFRLDGPLPQGRLAIEASAGTGKTYTLSTLAARYVAEAGVPIGDILIVTFTRAAAAELKDRVRARLVDFDRALSAHAEPEDDVEKLIRSTDRQIRLDRVRTAITEFDSATITTIHGFAQQVLGTLGSAVPTDPDAVLVNDAAVLIEQVGTDLLVAEAVHEDHDGSEIPDLEILVKAAKTALSNPDARLVPDSVFIPTADRDPGADADDESDMADRAAGADADDESDMADRAAARLRSLVDQIRTGIARRRSESGTMSFDDLLVRLRAAVTDPAAGATARQGLQHHFQVALIDEFQDTDPVQWDIFDAVFGQDTDDGDAATTLVLVGDPKQAIYAFRGANVHTYLQAAHAEGTDRTGLGTNWRSDPDVLSATEALLEQTTFGDERITFTPVQAAPDHADRRIQSRAGGPVPALSIRLMDGPGVPRANGSENLVTVRTGDEVALRDLAVYLRDLLDTMQIPDEENDGEYRNLEPDDCAVLVSSGRQGIAARVALTQLGIPAVMTRGDDVLDSEAATHWHRLLAAVARPADPRRARAATLSWFMGWDANRLHAATEFELSAVQEQLQQWGEHLSTHGVAAFIGHIRAETAIASRVLALADGDRIMTDIDHIAELLTLSAATDASPTTLLATFEELSGGSDNGEPETDLAARRVESEASAVQIMTTFVAKGLEFPVVCCPTLWWSRPAEADFNVWWDEVDGKRTIDVATGFDWGPPEELDARQAAAAEEAVGTNLRTLYVALTRARHHTAIWWVPTKKGRITGLARVLFARDDNGGIDSDAFTAPEVDVVFGDEALDRLQPLVDRTDGRLEVSSVDRPDDDEPPWSGRGGSNATSLDVATLDGQLDRDRTRWSFTSITARAHDDHAHRFDPLDDALGDAGDADESPDVDQAETDTGSDVVSDHEVSDEALPLGDIAGGAGFGTLVHEVLERVDFTAPDLAAAIEETVIERLAWNPWPVDLDQLVAGLVAVVETPLGPLFGDQSLRALSPTDRLDELDFDLTMGEGGHRARDADIGSLLIEHLATTDPLRGWAERLAAGPFSATLAGHLTGSIDLVARVRHPGDADRYVVSDYKTNRLAPGGVTPTPAMFRPSELPDAMAEHQYPLQALLYAVALHRYLRWRLPAYDPEVNLGGVGYLFVRGMTGPDTPTVDGVPYGLFDWRPPTTLITGLSDLLDGHLTTTGGAR